MTVQELIEKLNKVEDKYFEVIFDAPCVSIDSHANGDTFVDDVWVNDKAEYVAVGKFAHSDEYDVKI